MSAALREAILCLSSEGFHDEAEQAERSLADYEAAVDALAALTEAALPFGSSLQTYLGPLDEDSIRQLREANAAARAALARLRGAS